MKSPLVAKPLMVGFVAPGAPHPPYKRVDEPPTWRDPGSGKPYSNCKLTSPIPASTPVTWASAATGTMPI